MKMAYIGVYAAVDVPALGRSVANGEAVEIEDSQLCDALASQGWEYVEGEDAHDDEHNDENEKDGDDS